MIKIVLFLFFSFNISFATLILNDQEKYYDTFEVEYFYDQKNSLDIEEVTKKQFYKTTNNFTFGYLDGTTWFKLTLQNNSSKEKFILHFSESIWKNFDLYEKKDQKWLSDKNGLDIPLDDRSLKDVHPTFKLIIEPNTRKTFYIKGKSIASQIGKFEIMTQDIYYDHTRLTITHIYLLFAFSLLSILILNIYSFFLTKERIYLYYITYTASFIIFSAMQSGFYLLFGFDGWNEGLHFVGSIVVLTLLLFSKKFLDLKENSPKLHTFFNISAVVFIVFSILILLNTPYITFLFNLYSTLFFFILFYAAIQVLLQGHISAKYYLIALIIYTPLMSLMILTFNTFLEYTTFNRHSFLLGAFIEIIFFTLILASKYRTISFQKMQLQQELISQKEAQELLLKEEIESQTKYLSDLNKQLKQAQKIAKLGYWRFDLIKDELHWSDEIFHIFEMKTQEFTPTYDNFLKMIHPSDREKVNLAYENSLKTKEPYSIKHRLLMQDGRIKWVQESCETKFDQNGEALLSIGVIQDITKEHLQEKTILEQSKLAAMGEMIGNIAHQWRQPLSVISSGSTGLKMAKEFKTLDDEMLIKTCEVINENAQYLSKTIDDFRDFIKGDRQKVEFMINDTIKSFLNLLEGTIKSNNIKVILNSYENSKIYGYPNELIQCLINLFNNSKDVLKKLQTQRYIFIEIIKEHESLIIIIRDNGGGIGDEVIDHIFEPYFTTKHKSQGTGLGLSMTHKLIVDGMDGNIQAQDVSFEYNEQSYNGAEFKITLPLH